MASRVVLNIDAKANKALAEIERMKKKLKEANTEAGGISKSFKGAGDSLTGMASNMAGMAAATLSVGAAFRGWREEIDRAREAFQELENLRKAAVGAGQTANVAALRQEAMTRQGIQPLALDVAQFEAFTGTAETVPYSRELFRGVTTATESAEVMGLGGEQFGALLGTLIEQGVRFDKAVNIAGALIQGAGSAAPSLVKSAEATFKMLPGQESALWQASLAGAMAGKPRAAQTAIGYYQTAAQTGYGGTLGEFISDYDLQRLPATQRPILEALRDRYGAAGQQIAGYDFNRERGAVYADPYARAAINLTSAERAQENLDAANAVQATLAQATTQRSRTAMQQGNPLQRFFGWTLPDWWIEGVQATREGLNLNADAAMSDPAQQLQDQGFYAMRDVWLKIEQNTRPGPQPPSTIKQTGEEVD